jgi:hypothetical protein
MHIAGSVIRKSRHPPSPPVCFQPIPNTHTMHKHPLPLKKLISTLNIAHRASCSPLPMSCLALALPTTTARTIAIPEPDRHQPHAHLVASPRTAGARSLVPASVPTSLLCFRGLPTWIRSPCSAESASYKNQAATLAARRATGRSEDCREYSGGATSRRGRRPNVPIRIPTFGDGLTERRGV